MMAHSFTAFMMSEKICGNLQAKGVTSGKRSIFLVSEQRL